MKTDRQQREAFAASLKRSTFRVVRPIAPQEP
jgi:hypothetical protein